MTFTELLGNVGPFGFVVMASLALLSLISVGVIVDKHRRFRAAYRQSQLFKPEFGKLLHGGDLQELIDALPQHKDSYVAQVVSAGVFEYDGVRRAGGDPVASLELVTSSLRDSMSETLVQLKSGLGFMATIGSTAPFIGLFGTVLGIMTAFQALAKNNKSEQLAGGISEALSATAVGLLVAIPAIIAYNYLQGRVQGQMLQVQGHVARLLPLLRAGHRERKTEIAREKQEV